MRVLNDDGLRAKGIDYSRPQLWRLEKAKKFPKRIRLGLNRIAWVEFEIDQYLLDRIAERDAASEREDAE